MFKNYILNNVCEEEGEIVSLCLEQVLVVIKKLLQCEPLSLANIKVLSMTAYFKPWILSIKI